MLGNRVTQGDDGTFSIEKLVIGSDMESFKFSKTEGIPCLFISNKQKYPFFYEEHTMQEFLDIIFELSAAGMIPFGNLIDKMRLDIEDKVLNVFIGPKKYVIKYNKLYIFSDEELDGLPAPIEKNCTYRVLDWLNLGVKAGYYEDIRTPDNFVNLLHFYPSKRNHKNGFCDAVAISLMTEEQLSDINWSDSYSRLKTKKLMKEAGIVGTKMGGNRHRPLEATLLKREVIPIFKNKYQELEGIEFL